MAIKGLISPGGGVEREGEVKILTLTSLIQIVLVATQ